MNLSVSTIYLSNAELIAAWENAHVQLYYARDDGMIDSIHEYMRDIRQEANTRNLALPQDDDRHYY